MSTLSPVPTLPWRAATLLISWFTIFGVIMAVSSIPMEGGCDVTQEKLMATLMGPLLGWVGFTSILGWSQPSLCIGIISFPMVFGPAFLMLFRCNTLRAFWMFAMTHIITVIISSLAFVHFCQNP